MNSIQVFDTVRAFNGLEDKGIWFCKQVTGEAIILSDEFGSTLRIPSTGFGVPNYPWRFEVMRFKGVK